MATILSEIAYKGWGMDITTHGHVIVNCNGEKRVYESPEPIKKTEQDAEYVFLTLESNNVLQFKFEEGSFLVGDLFDEDGNHIKDFSSHVFGEDIEE